MKENIKAHKIEVETTIQQAFANLQQLLHQSEEALLTKIIRKPCQGCTTFYPTKGTQHLLDSMSHCHSLRMST